MIERSWSCSMPNLGTTILANKKEKWWSQWIFLKICGNDFKETFQKCRRHRWRRWSPRVSAQSRSKAFSEKPEQPRSSWLRWVAILVCNRVILDRLKGKLGARGLPVESGPFGPFFVIGNCKTPYNGNGLLFSGIMWNYQVQHIYKMQDSAIRKDIIRKEPEHNVITSASQSAAGAIVCSVVFTVNPPLHLLVSIVHSFCPHPPPQTNHLQTHYSSWPIKLLTSIL